MIGLQEGLGQAAVRPVSKFRGYIVDNGQPQHVRLLSIFSDGWIPLTSLLPKIIPRQCTKVPAYEIAGKELTRAQLRGVAQLLIDLGLAKPLEEVARNIVAGSALVPLPPRLFSRVVSDEAMASIIPKLEGHDL